MKLGAFTSAILAASALMAQSASPLAGTFVLSEEGVLANGTPFASLARITASDSGAITGTQVVQGVTYDLQGALATDADGSSSLSLTASATNSDGETIVVPVSYKLVRQAAGRAAILRTNPGIYSAGTLEPEGAAASIGGTFYIVEEPFGRPAARLVVLTLASGGTVSGYEIVNSVLSAGKRELTGTFHLNASGFNTLSTSVTTTGEDGDAITATENYVLLPTQTEVKALRIDSGANRIITFEK